MIGDKMKKAIKNCENCERLHQDRRRDINCLKCKFSPYTNEINDDMFKNDELMGGINQLLEYKEKCKELEKENKLLHLELGNVLDERVEEKQDALLGKALKWASNNNIEFVEGLSNVRYLSVQDHEIEELLNLYQRQLEKPSNTNS